VLLLTVFIGFNNYISSQGLLKIYQIDVNQGDAALIVSPTNKYVLIDAGHISGNYGDTVFQFLRNLGISHLDHIIASHYHEDHIGGIPQVINRLGGLDSIYGWCYDYGDTYTSATFLNYKNAVGNKRRTIGLGETLNLGGGAFMVCIARNGKLMNGDSVSSLSIDYQNYRSIVLLLKYGLFEFYTGGDLTGSNDERNVETKVAPLIRDVDIIKVNHHGSRTSSNSTFLDSLRPEVAIISQGTHPPNTYGHPHQEAINRLVARNCYIYQLNDNPQGGTFSIPDSGKILNTTAVITVNNWEYIINRDTYPIDGVNRDGEVMRILYPKDTIPEGILVKPKVRIRNRGNTTEMFPIRFKIIPGYNQIKTITNLMPDDSIDVELDTTWLAVRGNYQISCSTEVPRDIASHNDKKTALLTVSFYDTELKDIIKPTVNETLFTTETLRPKVIIKDNSAYSYPSSVKVFFQIRNNSIYLDSMPRILNPGKTDTLIFKPLILSHLETGTYRCSSWIRRQNDLVPTNNYKALSFVVKNQIFTTWESLPSVPLGTKAIKDGGCLVADTTKIYALKGNNTREFYAYNPKTRIWQPKSSIPYSPFNTKNVKKGGAMTYGEDALGNKVIYVLKGNNTYEMWRYYIEGDSWQLITGMLGQAVKAGSSIAYAVTANDSKYVYCLKGSNKNYEFLAYDVSQNRWTYRKNAPAGSDGKRFNDGSGIVAVGETIYALKGGAKYNEFYCYDIRANDWFEIESLPQNHPAIGRRKKVKSGGAITFDGANRLYVIKGGGTQEFWCYEINHHRWIPLETIPKGKSGIKGGIKSGGSLTALAGKIYCLKGNNTYEFWRYNPEEISNIKYQISNISQGIQSPSTGIFNFNLDVNPNPLIRLATIRYSVSTASKVSIKLYDATGRLVETLLDDNLNAGIYTTTIPTSRLAKGVYFLRYQDNSNQKQIKLIVTNR
ncbi:MAG: T9SS type A sorting domain-containing protein, partial [candidate division WOR-3 bacterium]|nr:T9SS type A sorting domain-containing protein [candidate division WOR-3 bacterium]